jgi:signal transduction histidine kinase/ActR/RegA family two-component response regulator
MPHQSTVRLMAAMAAPGARFAAAQNVAAHIGASTLLIFVEDPAVNAYLPAPGFPQTLSGAGWRPFLSNARESAVYRGRLAYPTADPIVDAVAFTSDGLMVVAIGGTLDPDATETLQNVMPFIAGCLRGEYQAMVARGELQAARAHAVQVEALARALDAARAEVERTVLSLERQARETQEARALAEEATRAKDEFLAMLGHELRNPLTPIVTAMHLLRMKHESSRELDIIDRQVASLSRLVEDLLDVSRITSGKIDLRKESVEFADIAARAIELSSPGLEKKSQRLSVAIAPTGLMVCADPSRLAQVFSNLLTNAAKYSDAGTEIVFAAERDGGSVRVRVKDHGIGLAPEMTTQVFELFVQNRQAADRAQGGLGLGLAIVRSIVELHDGNVTANSEGEGRGSEFIVTLPLAAADTSRLRPPIAAAPGAARAGHGMRVLVVDDNEDSTTLLSEALTACGHTVRTAADGPTALGIAGEFRPQIAILDIGLPVMNGYELAGRMQDADRGDPPLQLIALTGYGQSQDKARSHEAGFQAHLVKPVSIDRLQQLVASMAQSADQAPIA